MFNLYSEYLLQEEISKKSGICIPINGININNIRYVDDTVIIAQSEEKLQAFLGRIVDKCKEYGMEINAKKTKTMHIGRDTKTLIITVGNAVFEQVSKYSYLGHMITEDVAVQIWIEKTRQKFWENKELLLVSILRKESWRTTYSQSSTMRSMDLFQDGSKEDTDVRNVVLQDTS
ncbi:endonuclease-reverse transcriptase [Elysia marginata]|uniref:Endonuclease-reverse transcriptase n=1 Tax=Elysia marginata TaxID=1093978 RepID=A0AAV4EBT6_9GAST|nr:endonuclease-reverse transcriptase [Elysia marginata]